MECSLSISIPLARYLVYDDESGLAGVGPARSRPEHWIARSNSECATTGDQLRRNTTPSSSTRISAFNPRKPPHPVAPETRLVIFNSSSPRKRKTTATLEASCDPSALYHPPLRLQPSSRPSLGQPTRPARPTTNLGLVEQGRTSGSPGFAISTRYGRRSRNSRKRRTSWPTKGSLRSSPLSKKASSTMRAYVHRP